MVQNNGVYRDFLFEVAALSPFQLYPYWPVAGEQVQHGNVIVQVERETEEHLYTRREIKLTNAKVVGYAHSGSIDFEKECQL